jgi:hypothetical protein
LDEEQLQKIQRTCSVAALPSLGSLRVRTMSIVASMKAELGAHMETRKESLLAVASN